jgi:hypothetical protein
MYNVIEVILYMKRVDLTGQKFGRLTVIERNGSKGRSAAWLCECGAVKTVASHNLKQGAVKSCGCLSKEIAPDRGRKSRIGERSRKHGGFGVKLYGVWAGMKRRCTNPNTKYYSYYGRRGITVCDDWSADYAAFRDWALSAGYSIGMSIERIDVNGNYTPDNCKWIPLSEQNANKRWSVKIEYQDKLYTTKELSEIAGLKERTVRERYNRGLAVEEIINPILKKNQY